MTKILANAPCLNTGYNVLVLQPSVQLSIKVKSSKNVKYEWLLYELIFNDWKVAYLFKIYTPE